MSIKLNAQSGGSVALDAPTQTTSSADLVFKLPVADGSTNQVLKTDGSKILSFGDPSPAAGEVVQVVMGTFNNAYSGTNFADVTSTSYVDYGDMFLNITPKFSDSKLIFHTNINARHDSAGGYTLYQLYDSTNSVSLMEAGMSHFYNASTTAYPNTEIFMYGTSGGTTTRKIQVRVKVVSSGTLNSDYRGEPRLMTLTEVKQ